MKLLATLFIFFISFQVIAQSDSSTENMAGGLSILATYSFLGDSGSSSNNLTPEIFYGWHEKFQLSGKFSFQVKTGPYLASQISIKDNKSYLPAIMLPGNGGVVANSYLVYTWENESKIFLSPIALGIKFLPGFLDTNETIIQHNFRNALGFQLKDLLILSIQYTQGWHNLTSQSSENFEKIFEISKGEKAKYLNITLQTKIFDKDTAGAKSKMDGWYLFASWRNFLNNEDFGHLPNEKIISLGLRKSFDFTSGTPAR